ncbi:MAG: putative sulfoacetate--CoA ligase [Syntrophorhabdus sp. PtaU1.Bin058]|nr:MAG: putative sulfoacetate--CoA ligase [Syntrophorhabdus sp. PtaU1.Bin058]
MKQGKSQDLYQDWSDIIERNAVNLTDKVYIQSLDQGRGLTFGEMNDYCNRLSNFLQKKRIAAGDRVSIIGKNTIETLVLYFGILKYGAIVNPIFFEESESNFYRIVNMVKPKIIFFDEDLNLDASQCASTEWIKFSEHGTGQKGDGFFTELKGYDTTFHGQTVKKEDVCIILYTSGTTETPKGIHISREGLFYMTDEITDRTGITGEDRVLEYRAYNWASVQLLTVLSSMFKGATLFLAKKFSRRHFHDWLKTHGITISSGVPAVINMLINEPVALRRDDIPALKYITSSAAPLSVESHMRFEELYGIPIQQMMGMTEAGWMAGNPPGRRKVGSVGLPMKHKEIRFLNEQGGECAAGEIGEMIVGGRSMGLCYVKDDGKTERFPEQGFPTGDLGYKDEEGYIYITGRKKDLIIRGGINISPMEITSRVMEHPAIREAATVGVPDSIYGEEVVCFVVTRMESDVSNDDIIGHCKKTLPDFKIPKKIIFLESLPRNQRGKVAKNDLLKLFEENSK